MRASERTLLLVAGWGMWGAGCTTNPPSMILSCQGLTHTCGPNGNDDCCNSLVVTGGMYFRSYDTAGDVESGNQGFAATVSDFRLDKYEVTVERFRAFVTAGKGTQASPPESGDGAHARITGSGWDPSWNASLAVDTAALVAAVKCNATYQTWTDSPGPNEARPMNCITWYEAMAFCAWDGGYLPTEAEWNYAASGGGDGQGQRAYPWSNPAGSLSLDGLRASYFDGADCVGDGIPGCAVTDLLRVGTKPMGEGRWGQSDLGGNVWEWSLDWYGSPYETPCNDCALVSSGTYRVLRGGSFFSCASQLRAGYRNYANPPMSRAFIIGVRCARTP